MIIGLDAIKEEYKQFIEQNYKNIKLKNFEFNNLKQITIFLDKYKIQKNNATVVEILQNDETKEIMGLYPIN